MMVAAHLDDLAAARSRGLRTAYVHRRAGHGPAVITAATDPDADLSVGSITELAGQLDC